MNRSEIIEALTALAGELERRGVVAEMYVVGGAAIALAFDERRATRDIDAVFEPKDVVYEAAAVVAERLGLPGGWLRSWTCRDSAVSPLPQRRCSR
jgi:methylmalonyl-CoA mutase cobalamin-binding subunit